MPTVKPKAHQQPKLRVRKNQPKYPNVRVPMPVEVATAVVELAVVALRTDGALYDAKYVDAVAHARKLVNVYARLNG